MVPFGVATRVLLIWAGPVFSDTPTKVLWPADLDVDVLALTGHGSSYFSTLAESYRGPDGRILPRLLAAHGRSAGNYDKIALAGFSAGHGLMNLVAASDTDLVDAIVAIDSCFSAIEAPRKKGYAAFAQKAANGGALLVFTVGPGGGPGSGATVGPGSPDFSTAYDCVMASVEGAGSLTSFRPPEGLPTPPQQALRSGGVVVLDYRQLRHDQHVADLSVPVMQTFLAPWLDTWHMGVWGTLAASVFVGFALVMWGPGLLDGETPW